MKIFKGNEYNEYMDDEQRDILKRCNEMFDEANKALEERRKKWKELYNQWINIKISQKRPRYKSSTRVNYCWITTQVKTPIILQSNPTVTFNAYDKGGVTEKGAAKLSKIVGKYLYNRNKMREKLVSIVESSEIFDAGFMKIGFDERTGPEKNGNMQGDIFAVPVDIFKMFPDPLATGFDTSRYVCHADIFPVSTLKKNYPQFANVIKSDLSICEYLYEDRKWQDRTPRVIVSDTDTDKIVSERAYVKEYWISADESDREKYPLGMIVTILNDQLVLKVKPYKYKHGKPPYIKFVSNLIPNEFWGMGDIEQVIPLNDTLNHRLQQLEDIANKCANLGWSVDPKAGKKAINNLRKYGLKPGLIKVMPPGLLAPDEVPQIPQYLYNEVQAYVLMIERVTGIGDVMQGRGDVRQRTARGIERLYEAGSSRIGLSVKLFEDSYKEYAYQAGSLIQQFYTEERKINIGSDQNTMAESFTVKPEELKEEYEVSIDSSAALPQDKQSRATLVFNLLKEGVLERAVSPDPVQKEVARIVLDTLEFPNREKILSMNIQPPMPQPGPQAGPQGMPPGMPQGMPQGEPPGMPEVAPGVPALGANVQEMAQAAGVTPEELVQIIQQAIQRPTP